MSLTTHIGYGPFQLIDFEAGELFARFDGALAKVCEAQPFGRLDHVHVWTNYRTSNAERIWLHKTAQAYAITEEQAWMIERRKKGNCHVK